MVCNLNLFQEERIGKKLQHLEFLQEDISKFATHTNWKLIHDYHFGGYAKVNAELVAFINQFKVDYHVALDPVYTFVLYVLRLVANPEKGL